MEENINYYEDELNKIVDSMPEYEVNFKMSTGDGKSTKYLALNKVSAKILRDWLNNKFDLEENF